MPLQDAMWKRSDQSSAGNFVGRQQPRRPANRSLLPAEGTGSRGICLRNAWLTASLSLSGSATALALDPARAVWPWLAFITSVVSLQQATRCMRKRWNFYHGGVLFLIYADMMLLTLALTLVIWPCK